MMKIALFLVIFTWIEIISARKYEVYWNVPTFLCHSHGLNFEEVEKNYGILQNKNDKFRGEEIAIMYDPGMFPAVLKNPNGSVYFRNGGIPQKGDLQKHLDHFKTHLEQQIEKDFSGLGIIDFESWRPIFKQNWASLQPYRDISLSIERKKHPSWSNTSIEKKSIKSFEKAGKKYMIATLKLAKFLRPNAIWGYYAYPYCFNLIITTNWRCEKTFQQDNDKIPWLWDRLDVLLPSVYIRHAQSRKDKIGVVRGRLQESKRIIDEFSLFSKILPYFGYKYLDRKDIRLSSEDIDDSFYAMLANGANGHIIWGSSDDFRSKEKCEEFFDYLRDILGPAVLKIEKIAEELGEPNENIVENPIIPEEILEDEENPLNEEEK